MPTAVDLFSGAGLFSYGVEQTGVNIVAAFDLDATACASYRRNHPTTDVRCVDVNEVDFRRWSGVDGVIASPPCVTFSTAAVRFQRNSDLPLQALRAVQEIRPQWTIIENVVPFKRFPSYRAVCEGLTSLGYTVTPLTLDAVDFGVPQTRRRVFVVATRSPRISPFVIQKTPPSPFHSVFDKDAPFSAAALAPFWQKKVAAVPEAVTTFIVTGYGFNTAWRSLDAPMFTLVAKTRNVLIVDRQQGARWLTTGEMKRVMGLPDTYDVVGARAAITRQLGNGVVPPVARAVAARLQNWGLTNAADCGMMALSETEWELERKLR